MSVGRTCTVPKSVETQASSGTRGKEMVWMEQFRRVIQDGYLVVAALTESENMWTVRDKPPELPPHPELLLALVTCCCEMVSARRASS